MEKAVDLHNPVPCLGATRVRNHMRQETDSPREGFSFGDTEPLTAITCSALYRISSAFSQSSLCTEGARPGLTTFQPIFSTSKGGPKYAHEDVPSQRSKILLLRGCRSTPLFLTMPSLVFMLRAAGACSVAVHPASIGTSLSH